MEEPWPMVEAFGILVVMMAFIATPAFGFVVEGRPPRAGDRHALERDLLLWRIVLDRGVTPFITFLAGVVLAIQTPAVIEDLAAGGRAPAWRMADGSIVVSGLDQVVLTASLAVLVIFLTSVWLQRPGWLRVRSPQLLLAVTRDHARRATDDPGWRTDARARLVDIENRRSLRGRRRLRARLDAMARRASPVPPARPGVGASLWLAFGCPRYVWPLGLAALVGAAVTAAFVQQTGAGFWECLLFVGRAILLPAWAGPLVIWLAAAVPWVRQQLHREELETAMLAETRRWLRRGRRSSAGRRPGRAAASRSPRGLRARR